MAAGRIGVTVDENGGRLSADVTAYLIHRRYTGSKNGDIWNADEGIETRPIGDPNRRLIQWPEQHETAGVVKNDATKRRYKRVVRILKRMRDEFRNSGADAQRAAAADPLRSVFLEHAVFNAPNHCFNLSDGTYYEDVKAVVKHLWNAAREPQQAARMMAVNGMHPLFQASESWSAATLEAFMLAAWQHVGFKN